MMQRCSPLDMRIALEKTELLRKAGIEFIPLPVKNDKHRKKLIKQFDKIMNEIIAEMERKNV